MVELHWATDHRLFALPGVDAGWWERRKRGQIYFPLENKICPLFKGSPLFKVAFSLAWYRFRPPYLRFILSLAFVPNMVDWSRRDLPPALSFLYYPLHFSRLFLKWGLRPDRKFLDD